MGSDIEIQAVDIGKQIAVLTDVGGMDKVFTHLAGGGTLIDYCKLVGMAYPVMIKWINDDKSRLAKYEAGKRAREDWLFERVLAEYKALSTFSVSELYNEAGGLRAVSEWSDGAKAAVAKVESIEQFEMVDGVKESVGEIKKVSVWDKTKTLDSLGRYLKMFREQIDINVQGSVSLVGALEDAEKRARSVGASVGAVAVDVEAEYEEKPI